MEKHEFVLTGRAKPKTDKAGLAVWLKAVYHEGDLVKHSDVPALKAFTDTNPLKVVKVERSDRDDCKLAFHVDSSVPVAMPYGESEPFWGRDV